MRFLKDLVNHKQESESAFTIGPAYSFHDFFKKRRDNICISLQNLLQLFYFIFIQRSLVEVKLQFWYIFFKTVKKLKLSYLSKFFNLYQYEYHALNVNLDVTCYELLMMTSCCILYSILCAFFRKLRNLCAKRARCNKLQQAAQEVEVQLSVSTE